MKFDFFVEVNKLNVQTNSLVGFTSIEIVLVRHQEAFWPAPL